MKRIMMGRLLAATMVGALTMILLAGGSGPRHTVALQGQLTGHCLHVGLLTVCYPT